MLQPLLFNSISQAKSKRFYWSITSPCLLGPQVPVSMKMSFLLFIHPHNTAIFKLPVWIIFMSYDWYHFNWSDYPDIIHIHIYIYYSSQNICIRGNGFRCIRYTACSEPNSFAVTGPAITQVGSLCSLDYVEITGAFGCGSMDNFTPHLADRICGEVFGTVAQASAAPMAVCGKISL